jgi:hypothetical protein
MLKMETNNSVSIRKEDVKDILDIASRLEGEEAIAQIIRFSDCPKDSMTGELALKSVLRFYSNVRYLQEILQSFLAK